MTLRVVVDPPPTSPLSCSEWSAGMAPVVHAAYPAIREAVLAEIRADLASEAEVRNLSVAATLGLHSWRLEEGGRG